MNTRYIILLISIITANNILGQKTNLGTYFKGWEMTSLRTATNIEEAYLAFDEVVQILIQEEEFSFTTTSHFSSPDTLLEFIRVDSCKTCFTYEKYIINISRGLSVNIYSDVVQYVKNLSLNQHYMYKKFYSYILNELRYFIINLLMNNKLDKERREEFTSFLETLLILSIDNGNVDVFRTKYYWGNFITETVCEAAKQQLKVPKHPTYLLDQYMKDNKHSWDPALIDTTGIPKKYLNDKFLTCRSSDTLCKKYLVIINKFRRYEIKAKEQGITPEEALYISVENDFYYKGFKQFTYLIDYTIEKDDMRLLPAVKEFIKEYPEYELTDKQRVFLTH